jgi:CDP-glucose 4,6-dehydratase
VYENPEKGVPFTEDDPLGGHDPYSASKAGSELVIASYRRSFFANSPIRLASARAGNVIGGGDFAADRIVPDFVRARLAGKPLHIRRPEAVRPWQHVLEPLAGYLMLGARLAHQPELATAFNFGPETEDVLTVKELIHQAEKDWPGEPPVFSEEAEGPHEAGLLLLDITKAKSELGFSPVWNAREAIRQTVLWYKNSEGSERKKCREQLLAYFQG